MVDFKGPECSPSSKNFMTPHPKTREMLRKPSNAVAIIQTIIAAPLLYEQIPLVLVMSEETNSWTFGIGVALLIDAAFLISKNFYRRS